MDILSREPQDGIKGLKENWRKDLLSGFLVSLLALPLSIGIAGASEFPKIMGLVTAMVGGLLVTLIAGSRMTIKGPAAGLIVIVAGCVAEFGGGETGWRLALGVIVVASVLQVAFGLLRFGKFSEFFPLSAVHGMLAAIGVIILAKQLHIIMGVTPIHREGHLAGSAIVEPLHLFLELPYSFNALITNPANQKVAIVGVVSLLIVFGWPLLKNKFFKRIPAPLLVLMVTIPLGIILNLKEVPGALVQVDNIFTVFGLNVSFDGIHQIGVFIKYVLMFAVIGSIESMLTVKAIDMLDPYKRKSNPNKDLIAVGSGNILTGLLGGLPMISEVARSSANIGYGARTRWSNFFHGLFLLIFVLLGVAVIELIPLAALAAMLIGIGYKLASPKEFHTTYKIGKEQLIIFLVTIVVTIATDLLIGMAAGILAKFIILVVYGLPLKNIIHPVIECQDDHGERTIVRIDGAAIFSNYFGIKSRLDKVSRGSRILVDLSTCRLIDHTAMENLMHFKDDYNKEGGNCMLVGLYRHQSSSKHPSAMVRLRKDSRELEAPAVVERGAMFRQKPNRKG